MEFLETIKPFTLIAYYIFVSFVVLLIILDNKKPEKAFAFITGEFNKSALTAAATSMVVAGTYFNTLVNLQIKEEE